MKNPMKDPSNFDISTWESHRYTRIDDESVAKLIKAGTWVNKDSITSYSLKWNLLHNAEVKISIVAESRDKKVSLAVLTIKNRVRAYVKLNTGKPEGRLPTITIGRIYEGYSGWWYASSSHDPVKIKVHTYLKLWKTAWTQPTALEGVNGFYYD